MVPSAPGNVPRSWRSPPCLPRGMQPLPGTLCHGFHVLPAPTHGSAGEFSSSSSSSRLTHTPPSNLPPPGLRATPLPPLQLSHHTLRASIGSASRAPRAAAAPAPTAPQGPAASAGAGAVPRASSQLCTTELPGRVTGMQGKQNPPLDAQIHPTDLEMQPWCSRPEHGLPKLSRRASRRARGCCQLLGAAMGEHMVPSGPVGSPRTATGGQQDPTTCKHSHSLGCGAVSRVRGAAARSQAGLGGSHPLPSGKFFCKS